MFFLSLYMLLLPSLGVCSDLQSGRRALPLQSQELLCLQVVHVHVALVVGHLLLQVLHVSVLAGPVDHHVDVVARVGHLPAGPNDKSKPRTEHRAGGAGAGDNRHHVAACTCFLACWKPFFACCYETCSGLGGGGEGGGGVLICCLPLSFDH